MTSLSHVPVGVQSALMTVIVKRMVMLIRKARGEKQAIPHNGVPFKDKSCGEESEF